MRLSVLDLISVRRNQTTAQSLRASKQMAEAADRLGFTRYWVAEHHNTDSVASTSPAVELMYLGQDTEQIRLGSGGVMLPNHAPLAVAEQFALLTAVYGDRIDLGIGRAPARIRSRRLPSAGTSAAATSSTRTAAPSTPCASSHAT